MSWWCVICRLFCEIRRICSCAKQCAVPPCWRGLRFSQTRTPACRSISYPMTMLYGVPHGLAAAMTLAQVAEKNRGHFENDGELFAVFAPYGGIQHWLDTVCGGVVSLRLSGFGIAPDQIETLAEHSFTGGRMDSNPVDLTGEGCQNNPLRGAIK